MISFVLTWQIIKMSLKSKCTRASDRVQKKIRNYVEIFRDIMKKKALIMWKTCWITRKITSFRAAKITLPPKLTFCSQANFKPKKRYLGLSSYFHLFAVSAFFIKRKLTVNMKWKILQSYPQVYRFNIMMNIVSTNFDIWLTGI